MPGDGEKESFQASQADTVIDPAMDGRVFISYASEDSAVANRVCAALEAAGLPCWIAPRDVRAGEPYAASIVEAINACRMVVLVLTKSAIDSPHVFREVERASSKKRSILSIHLDAATLPPELEYFLSANHWMEASTATIEPLIPKLIEAVRGRLPDSRGRASIAAATTRAAGPTAVATGNKLNRPLIAIGVVLAVALAYLVVDRLWPAKQSGTATNYVAPATPRSTDGAVAKPGVPIPAFSPPPHSIAVLPFVNMSGDPKQDYFSDGLSEELLNSLVSVRDLHVAARTSSFFFKGKEVDLSDVAHKLNVGAVLEGSVRKDGDQVRITAQLIDAVSGFHLWSQTYDRDLKSILKLQTEIATAVTKALQATLLAEAAVAIELGGTQNPQALDAYLRAKQLASEGSSRPNGLKMLAAYDEAIRLDPRFSNAFASKAISENGFAEYYGLGGEIREHFQLARAAAQRSLELTPELGAAHSALARVLADGFFDFRGSLIEHERALAFSPNDSGVLLRAAWFFADIGRNDEAAVLARRGVSLDQLNPLAYRTLAIIMDDLHRYPEVIDAANRSLTLNPKDTRQAALRGLAFVHMGNAELGRQSCDQPPLDWESHLCLAIVYDKLHRRADAEAEVAQLHADMNDGAAFQFAEIYAQWGDISKSLDWLETAYRIKDPGIVATGSDEFLSPIRNAPRYQEILHKLNLPN
jgi:TolB-like protein